MASLPTLRGLICERDPDAARAVRLLMHGFGFEAVVVEATASEAAATAGRATPQLLVVGLASCGIEGLGSVRSLMAAAPGAPAVVIVPFSSLAQPALEAGAVAVLNPTDFRPLVPWLQRVRAVAHGGLTCDCCRPSAGGGAAPVMPVARSYYLRIDPSGPHR